MRWLEEEARRVCFSVRRDCVGSEKMSFGMGIRPCSNGSRRGWIMVGACDVEGSIGSVMVREKESEIGEW